MTPSNHTDKDRSPQVRTFRCPTCKRVVKLSEKDSPGRMKFFPFCSERCRLIDLGAWFDADYRIPNRPDEESEDPSRDEPPAPRKPR